MDTAMRERLEAHQKWIKEELDICVNFWLKNGMDHVNGGVYTCLDRKGEIYSTDKSVWMQGRCAWMFAYLCHQYGVKEEWLQASKSCLDFMEAHCINREAGNRMYFTVTAEGKPLRQRRYCFSEGFYAIANAEYYGVTGDAACLERARAAYELIYQLNNGLIQDPTGMGPKTISTTRTGRALADPMIYLNITSVLRRVDTDPERQKLYAARAQECVETIFQYHYKPELKCTLESVAPDGTPRLDVTEGRVVNPGHDIECSWFLMEAANYAHDAETHATAVKIFDQAFEAGWDKEYGGLLYFIDCLGKPTEAYEHDMKLWWPHDEILIASMMIFRDTGDVSYLEKFEQTLDYCKKHFSDREYGEWYGYLRRDGLPTMPSTKGSTFKGPFHLPRMLSMVDNMLGQILARD
ncbi:AGE family epimerase/isomerase [Pseudoflavonifractor sp. DSM 107456]|uniref:AGE family epimerase/isomerase n=2 Tax=Pseudoflavonifractor gallinarum TaxID=2779352 RepID=A0ABR9RB97_9FIRM|nr:AGE family epimerase/isomerase [Pseudoflavonifractor gallinarum]MBS5136439.1 AGE family epimerase/isomerase [Oscillospiraceae bacterium]